MHHLTHDFGWDAVTEETLAQGIITPVMSASQLLRCSHCQHNALI